MRVRSIPLSIAVGVLTLLGLLTLQSFPGRAQTAGRPSQCPAIADSIERSLVEMTALARAAAAGRISPEQARPQLVELQATVERGHRLLALQSCVRASAMQAASWTAAGVSDCSGADLGQSEGASPQAAMCTGEARTAICWDGNERRNGQPGHAWCTYKSTAAAQCRGGGAPGLLFACGG